MTVQSFYVEAGHIMMFARSIGDSSPVYDPTRSDPAKVVAPPTFVQASAQFDPDCVLRPAVGAQGWFGSGGSSSGARAVPDVDGSQGPRTRRLHAEQQFEYHHPVTPGMVLSATSVEGDSWEKESKRGGTLQFSETITEYRDQHGQLVVVARSVVVCTERVVESGT